MEYSATKDNIKSFAKKIEQLAKDLQSKIDSGDDYLPIARELTKDQITLVFTLGEVYALEKTVNVVKVNKTKSGTSSLGYYNFRDKFGRFCKK